MSTGSRKKFSLNQGSLKFSNFDEFCGDQIQYNCISSSERLPLFCAFFGLGFCHHDFFQIPLGFDQVLVKVHFFPMEFRPKPGLLGSLDKRRLMSRKIKRIRRRFWGADLVGYSLEQFCNLKNHQNRDMNT